MILTSSSLMYAENVKGAIYDESIDDYITINVLFSQSGVSRVQGLDSLENVVYDYTCDYNEGYFYSHLTNEFEYFEPGIYFNELDMNMLDVSLNYYSSDDIPDLCNGPSSVTDSIPLTILLGGTIISAGAIAIKLAAWLGAVTALSSGTIKSIAGGIIGIAASDIYSSITSGDWGREVYFRIKFSCVLMWESDPFDPQGGFYFYGQKVSDIDYLGTY